MLHIKLYDDSEKLYLKDSVGLTREVKEMIEKEKKRLWTEEKRKVSRAKIVCNLIIEKYGDA